MRPREHPLCVKVVFKISITLTVVGVVVENLYDFIIRGPRPLITPVLTAHYLCGFWPNHTYARWLSTHNSSVILLLFLRFSQLMLLFLLLSGLDVSHLPALVILFEIERIR